MQGAELAAATAAAPSMAFAGPVGAPVVDADWDAFDPWRMLPLRHRLHEHPLLQLDRLVEFGERMQRASKVRAFSNAATAGSDFNAASREHPYSGDAAETLQRIADAHAWMLLGNIQTDDVYRDLVDLVLDEMDARIRPRDPGMFCRAGWIIVSSPRTVTPFHMDKGNGVLLHVMGDKTVYVWEPDDIDVASEAARDRYHHHGSLDLLHWREEYRERARVFRLKPGEGIYMPSTSPHMVETGNTPSITITLTYSTPRTRRNALLHAANDVLRETGMAPFMVGRHPLFDDVAYAGLRTMLAARDIGRRARGRPSAEYSGRYALPAEPGDARLSR